MGSHPQNQYGNDELNTGFAPPSTYPASIQLRLPYHDPASSLAIQQTGVPSTTGLHFQNHIGSVDVQGLHSGPWHPSNVASNQVPIGGFGSVNDTRKANTVAGRVSSYSSAQDSTYQSAQAGYGRLQLLPPPIQLCDETASNAYSDTQPQFSVKSAPTGGKAGGRRPRSKSEVTRCTKHKDGRLCNKVLKNQSDKEYAMFSCYAIWETKLTCSPVNTYLSTPSHSDVA
ncbi:uncharacterized protein LTR77_001547 [Saxophila tyrrhenica]|uniref:Uncharacterized protein n=1 Tax=Saxophila tyrrhenica TaxID=1690608 RepID=A0AAV9PME6_9PEZI|nr:hypothetical protein LTR77_001547 [Saxophila tyrrhenica]